MPRDRTGAEGAPPPAAIGARSDHDEIPALRLARWTVTSGSNAASRGAVVIDAGDHHWQASSQGNGAVDALLEAVDKALADLLGGAPRLVGYNVHALAEGPDSEVVVSVRIRPPAGAAGARGNGEYPGESRHTNIIAASIEAYVIAINAMLDEVPWAGVTEDAGRGRRAARHATGRRAEFDRSSAHPDTTKWFDQ